jgi:Papain fold toxin 2
VNLEAINVKYGKFLDSDLIMTDAPDQDFLIQKKITAIAEGFPIFACFDCAAAIRSFLVAHAIAGQQLFLSTGNTQKPFCNIYCDRLQQNISVNGRHTAIAVLINEQELIFDNIHPQGISRVQWIESFHSPIQDLGQHFQITATAF